MRRRRREARRQAVNSAAAHVEEHAFEEAHEVLTSQKLEAEANQLAHEAAMLSSKLDSARARIRELEVQLAQAVMDAEREWPQDNDPPDPL